MDIRQFFYWITTTNNTHPLTNEEGHPNLNFITMSVIQEYIQTLSHLKTPIATINRRLSALRLFFQCAELHAWCTTSPMLTILNIPVKEEVLPLIEQFDTYLLNEETSEKTRKNYRTDVQEFIKWIISTYFSTKDIDITMEPQILLPQITFDALKRYKITLLSSSTPIATINRRLSAIRKLFQFALQQQWVSEDPTTGIHNCKEDALQNLEKTLNEALFSYTKTASLNEKERQHIIQFFFWIEESQVRT